MMNKTQYNLDDKLDADLMRYFDYEVNDSDSIDDDDETAIAIVLIIQLVITFAGAVAWWIVGS